MRTCRTRIARRGGFTFIEVMVVLTVLAVTMSIAVPAFQAIVEGERTREINRLTSLLQVARAEAILKRRSLMLQVDLVQHAYWMEAPDDGGKYLPMEEPRSFRRHVLPESIRLHDMMVWGNSRSRLAGRTVGVVIDSSGFVDPFLLHFTDQREEWTLRVSGFSGRTETIEGFSDDLAP